MPDLERCVSYEGKIYCWNNATKKVAVIDIRDLDFKNCPEQVLQAIIANGSVMPIHGGGIDA